MENKKIIVKNDALLPKILIIIPFGLDNNIFDNFINKFNDYNIVFYNMNGEDFFSPYISFKNRAIKIVDELKENNMDDFELIFSLSTGGIISVNIFAEDRLSIKKCIVDSTPLLNLDKITKLLVQSKIMSIVEDVEKLKTQNSYISGHLCEKAVNMVKNTSLNTLKKVSDDILSFNFPKIDAIKQKNFIMRYGNQDLAYQSVKTLKTAYRKSTIYVKADFNHCQEFVEENDKYLSFIKEIMEKE